jgi:pantoate--beta-alanine ligase
LGNSIRKCKITFFFSNFQFKNAEPTFAALFYTEFGQNMRLVETITEVKQLISQIRCSRRSIGFVPTMGALHEGHLQLLRTAAAQNDVIVSSIFVNPTQFNNPEDYRLYPRLLEEDLVLLRQVGCDLVFAPPASVMYPQEAAMTFNFGKLEEVMEGQYRPGHFNGVAVVVSKLFNIVKPDRAYFGQKDLQQFAIIRQLVHDLSFDLELVCHPIIRAEDGLALSSRNRRLSPEQRQEASCLFKALELSARKVGQEPFSQIKAEAEAYLAGFPAIRLEYFEIADADTLQPLHEPAPAGKTALCLAAWVGPVRLIDNIVL